MKALILVDIQNDFLPGGALAVPEGDQIIPILNQLQKKFDLVVATKDWHPTNHGSFASNHPGRKPGEVVDLNGLQQILWQDHCVQNTRGSEFAPSLDASKIARTFFKGTDPKIDSYSTFFDNAQRKSTGMENFLKGKGVKEVYIAGLATDYCVKYSALDAIRLGFDVTVIIDACRGVNLKPDDSDKALEEMKQAGVRIVKVKDLSKI
ncbi:bifunctional nicotinamidase/pyrazinamidase [Candidatus Sumerlaeota bacterium]|nr:bifunctional nicotinamidase/pyrazinamidase [Candidatus Sumerlaeota bacterium]